MKVPGAGFRVLGSWFGVLGFVVLGFLVLSSPLFAQTARDTRLLLTVVDQSNGILPTATVTVTGIEPATQKVQIAPARTGDNGIAVIAGLVPGRYNVEASFPGFDTGSLKDIRLRPGDNKHIIILGLQKLQETVEVGQDAQAAAADRRSSSFGTALTREQIDALSDDPNEMQQQLSDMAGPGAVIRVDSFEGGRLPPKSMIKAIHVTRDQFAAENHNQEGLFIDIITQPGVGPIRGNMRYSMHNSALTARNPFSAVKPEDQTQNYGVNFNGGLIKNKASFSFGTEGNAAFDNPIVTVVQPDGTHSDATAVKSPRSNNGLNGSFDYAITKDQTIRLRYNQFDSVNKNIGVGGFNLPEHAFRSENHSHNFRFQEAGPIGRRFFINTRLNLGWTDTAQRAATEAVTVRVQDAFTSGGAQVRGGRHSKDFDLGSDLDYVRGRNSFRAGLRLEGNRFRSDDASNYLGTYVFENLDAYIAGTPRSYTRRIGDPTVRYFYMASGFYAQDDFRVSKALTFTPGVRYEAQTQVKDYNNVMPRFGVTWAPFKNGKTTVRGSAGIFYDWLGSSTYEQTLRVDGFKQQELQVANPSYPDPGAVGTVTAVNRYLLDPSLRLPRYTRFSGGVEYAFRPQIRFNAGYRYGRSDTLFRGKNLNSPVAGVRPDPTFGNVVEVVSDAGMRQNVIQLGGNTAPPNMQGVNGPRLSWKRFNFFWFYTYAKNTNNTDGAFNTPADGNIADDWGPTGSRQRFQAAFNTGALRNLNLTFFFIANSGNPYNITTGRDDNGDLIFNDRPAGFERNSATAAGQWWLNAFGGYTWYFGPKLSNLPPGIQIFGGPGGIQVNQAAAPSVGRYRVQLTVNVQNLTNHANFGGYSGNQLSPFYLQPTNATNQRRIDVGLNLGF